jgi:hypothetical protein
MNGRISLGQREMDRQGHFPTDASAFLATQPLYKTCKGAFGGMPKAAKFLLLKRLLRRQRRHRTCTTGTMAFMTNPL